MKRLCVGKYLFLLSIVFFTNSVFAETEFFLYGNHFINDSILKDNIENNNYEYSFEKIIKLYNNNGFPFVVLSIDSIIEIGDKQIVYVNIDEGGLYSIASIKNKGDINSLLLNRLLRISGLIFNDSLILQRLNTLKYYDYLIVNTKYYPYLNNDKVDIITFINREKGSNIIASIFMNLDSLSIDGFLSLYLLSPSGYGRKYQLYYYRNGVYENTLNIFAQFPYIFNMPFGINIKGDYNSRDSVYSDATANFNIVYDKINYTIFTGISRKWELYSYIPDSNKVYNSINSGIEIKYHLFSININYEHNFYDNVYFRLSGLFTLNNSFKKHSIKNTVSFNKLYADILTRGMLIVLGGETIKGFINNFTYIKDKVEYMFEYNYHFSNIFSAGIFFNYALFSKTFSEYIYDNYIYSYGPYIKYKTNDIVFNFYYAIPLNKYFNGRIHIGLEYVF